MKIGEIWKSKFTKEKVKILKFNKKSLINSSIVVFSYVNDPNLIKSWERSSFIDGFKKLS